jgi:DNA-binding CsgD family transcriptional regulator
LADLAHGLDCAAAAVVLRTSHNLAVAVWHGLSHAAVEAYVAHWHRLDPWLQALSGPFAGRALCGADLSRAKSRHTSTFNASWLSPNGLGSAGIAEITEAHGVSVLLCVWRRAGARSLSRADAILLRSLASALALILSERAVAPRTAAAAAVANCAAAPVFVLHGDSTLVWANAAAETLWTQGGPLRRAGPKIVHRAASQTHRFAQAVADAAVASAHPLVFGLDTDSGPVPLRLQPLALSPTRWGVALVAPPRRATPPEAGTIAVALGLTRTQSEVAVLLCRGLETAEIASLIGISPNTLNGHLRDLYLRLRAANRVQAVVRILSACAALSMLSSPARAGGETHQANLRALDGSVAENLLINPEGTAGESSALASSQSGGASAGFMRLK